MTFDPFDLVRGVPRDVLDAKKVEAPTDYLRVDAWTTRDDEFREFRRAVGPLALAWWTGLLLLTKREGVYGVIDVDPHALSVEATGTADYAGEVAGVLLAARDAGLLWMTDGNRVRVRRWAAWQAATGRERSRLTRARTDATPERVAATPERVSDTADRSVQQHKTETKTKTPPNGGPPPRARAGAREADDPRAVITAALADLYPDPALAARAADELWSGAFMRKARFRHGVSADALVAGIRDLVDHRRRDPSFAPRDVVEYVVGRAVKWNPDAADLSLPTIKNGDPRDRLTIPSDERFARFDGPARPR